MDRRLLNQAIEMYLNTGRARPLSLTAEEVKNIAEQYFINGVPMHIIAKVGRGNSNEKYNYSSVKGAIYWIRKAYNELSKEYTPEQLENSSIDYNYESIKNYVLGNQSKPGTRVIYNLRTNFGLSESAAVKAFHQVMDEWCYPTIPLERKEAITLDGYTS